MIVTKALQKVLDSHRDRFNADFRKTQVFHPRLDGEGFLALLETFLNEAQKLSSSEAQDSFDRMVQTLYDKFLRLSSLEILGKNSRFPRLEQTLLLLARQYPHLFCDETESFIAMVVNGFLNVAAFRSATADAWVQALLNIQAPVDKVEDLRDIGLVAAWVCGLAGYRNAALEAVDKACRNGAAGTLLSLLSIDEHELSNTDQNLWLDKIKRNPWMSPKETLDGSFSGVRVTLVGGFSGFDGLFCRPPLVFRSDSGFVATDGSTDYQLFADCFGSMFVRIRPEVRLEETKPAESDWIVDGGHTLMKGTRTYKLPAEYHLPIGFSAGNETTFCFTTSLSHKVFIFGFEADGK